MPSESAHAIKAFLHCIENKVGHSRKWIYTTARNRDGRCCYCGQILIRNWDQKWALPQVIWMIINHTAMLRALTARYLTSDSKRRKPEMDRPFLPVPVRPR